MTHDDNLDQPELRELLEERASVSDVEVEPLRRYVEQLPPRRRSRGRWILAAAAGIVVVLAGLGAVAVLTVPWGSSGAAPWPPNPAYFANDPRLAVCNATVTDAVAIFELVHVADYAAQLPNAYPLTGLQANPSDPALVIVFKGPGSVDRGGETAAPGTHDLFLVVGADAAHWQQIGIVAVDTTGLAAFKPEPTGTPLAADLLPWVQQCGGVSAGINRVLQLPHGTDAMTLNSVQVPISLMTADPMTIVVYDGAHPFAPLGTPPAPGATVAPRDPGYQDLCILVGSDPAKVKRTIVESGPAGQITGPSGEPVTLPAPPTPVVASTAPDAPSGSIPPASPSSVLRPQISAADCAALGFSDNRCLAVVEQARQTNSLDWSQIVTVHLAKPATGAWLGGAPVADVTFTMADGTTAKATTTCLTANQGSDPVCTDRPEIQLSMPYGPGSGYNDVPCGSVPAGEPGASCATPLPTVDPAATSVPLRIASVDYGLTVGSQVIYLGQATLPNGILSDAHFSLADRMTQAFGVTGPVQLVITSTDPSRPAFDNAFSHGWHPGSEVVSVSLVLDVTSVTPGATLQVRDLVVR